MHDPTNDPLLALAAIGAIGALAQWLAWRFKQPSILLLLFAGILAGPVLGWVEPDRLFGESLFPIVSLAVAIILFEGGLSLRWRAVKDDSSVVRNLVTIGTVITWTIGTVGAHFILDLPWELAVLLGAILVVTGPTVVVPLLRHVRPTARVATVLTWEGIVIDPIGASLAVLAFEAVVASGSAEATANVVASLVRTLAIGAGLGVLGAAFLIVLIRRGHLPERLHNLSVIGVLVSLFAVSNALQAESGLLTATVLGIVLANQSWIDVGRVLEFKENLRLLLITALFILLAARLDPADLAAVRMPGIMFVALLVLVARPLAVMAATIGSRLNWRERLFAAWMAPRGIVAAAVSSVFALEMAEQGYAGADRLVSITFLVIIATVAIYGLTAAPVARALGVADENPQGVLILGAHGWARDIAALLVEQGITVRLVDSNRPNTRAARMAGLDAVQLNILADGAFDEIDLAEIGRFLALTPNDEVNSLAALHAADAFDRDEIYQLPPVDPDNDASELVASTLRGHALFHKSLGFTAIRRLLEEGYSIRATPITTQFTYEDFIDRYGENAHPLLIVHPTGALTVIGAERSSAAAPGDRLIALTSDG